MELDRNIASEILKNNIRREYSTLSKYSCKSSKGIRINPERIPDRENIRPTFFHDTDRIIHSKAYTRYIDKTQAFFLFENDHITHRVLHVQFVSKIGRVIGRCLKLNEDLIEAISLGHDLGHVPYGHDGENHLNRISQREGIGYFRHNAQSVRFLMDLENSGKGLNLTLQVLDGILCHNGELLNQRYEPNYDKTLDNFLEEYNGCWEREGHDKKIIPMTLEGCVMRIADVIAYIGRDIEDAIIVNLIKREDLPEQVTWILGDSNDQIINNLVIDLVNNSYGKNHLAFSKEIFNALESLLNYNYQNIYQNPKKLTENTKISRMFDFLFDQYQDDILYGNTQSSIYKWWLDIMDAGYTEKYGVPRVVIDFISGMTDDFFNNEFKKLVIPKNFDLVIDC